MAQNAQEFAEKILEELEKGTAPWVKPWKPAHYLAQHNPVSKTIYKGANLIMLSILPYQDPRWVTFKQAKEHDWSVRKGEHGHSIFFFSRTQEITKKDENGKPVKDDDGNPVKIRIFRSKPLFVSSVVFNAEQIDGMPPMEIPNDDDWHPHERAEQIVQNCQVPVFNDQSDRAFYQPVEDDIHLPPKSSFSSVDGYYATLLHEIGHSTGHASRFNREILNFFGTESYAKEELRAEIASWMLGLELGIGHDPGQHTAYIQSWIRNLREKPTEIFAAARDAQRICETVLSMENGPVDWDELRAAYVRQKPQEEQAEKKDGRTYLNVAYKERKLAKSLGAQWDPEEKSWYAPEGVDLEPLRQFWKPDFMPQEEETLAPAM